MFKTFFFRIFANMNLHNILRQKNLTTKEEVANFLVVKTVTIVSKSNENNYGKIGDKFIVEKVGNFNFGTKPYAQLKNYCNKIYFSDLQLVINFTDNKGDIPSDKVKKMNIYEILYNTEFTVEQKSKAMSIKLNHGH